MSTTLVNPGSEPEKSMPEAAKSVPARKPKTVLKTPETQEPEDTTGDDGGKVEEQATELEVSEEPEEVIPVEEKMSTPAQIEAMPSEVLKPIEPLKSPGHIPGTVSKPSAGKSGAALMRFSRKQRKRR